MNRKAAYDKAYHHGKGIKVRRLRELKFNLEFRRALSLIKPNLNEYVWWER